MIAETRRTPREFQVFAKPAGPRCNLDCEYCYYLKKESLYRKGASLRMPQDVLEKYIFQQIQAWPDAEIFFSWHGGEPTVLGVDYFRTVVALERKHQPPDVHIINGMQTNGTLLNDAWCQFLAAERFAVGLSLDGPRELHDRYRTTKDGKSSYERSLRGYRLLQEHGVLCELLCVVNADNVRHPEAVYDSLRELEAPYLTFLPLVEPRPDAPGGVSERSVPAEAFGAFLCAVFDEWTEHDIGRVKVQIFEEAARPAFGQEHSLCIFKETCGRVPVVEHNGDFYACDHFVEKDHHYGNILTSPLVELLESPAQRAFGHAKLATLPRYCRTCEVRAMCNGGCPKNRCIRAPDGEPGLNYLCPGYKGFFNHCRPFVDEVATLWHQQQ